MWTGTLLAALPIAADPLRLRRGQGAMILANDDRGIAHSIPHLRARADREPLDGREVWCSP